VPDAPARRRLAKVLVVLAGPALLLAQTLAFCASFDFEGLESWRRLWTDLALATTSWVDRAYGPAPDEVAARGAHADAVVRSLIRERVARQRLRATRPLELAHVRPFALRRVAPEAAPYDDRGRAVLLGLAFRLRGGIAPFMVLWLGFVIGAPLVAWTGLELWDAGRPRGAAAWSLLVGFSPFVAETLALARYPVGFYLAAALLLPPLAVYAALRPAPTLRGLFARFAVAAGALALCTFCRSSAAVLLPGFVLAGWVGLRRLVPGARRRTALAAAIAVVCALPLALVPRAQRNDVWQPVWEGLGDFDRTRGFTWSDEAAQGAVRRAGGHALFTAESEAILRAQVLAAVARDPFWFGAVLARRALSTVTLWKLWPWRPTAGIFIRRAASPNEGVIDKYWTYTTTVDHLGLGRARLEVPVPLLLAPSLALLLGSWRGRRSGAARATLAAVACVAAATLVLPVLVTTAGGQETQAFALAHLLAAALLVDRTPGGSGRDAG
jgi:hypothetical protein